MARLALLLCLVLLFGGCRALLGQACGSLHERCKYEENRQAAREGWENVQGGLKPRPAGAAARAKLREGMAAQEVRAALGPPARTAAPGRAVPAGEQNGTAPGHTEEDGEARWIYPEHRLVVFIGADGRVAKWDRLAPTGDEPPAP